MDEKIKRLHDVLEKVEGKRITRSDRVFLWLIYKLGGEDVYLKNLKYFFTHSYIYKTTQKLVHLGLLITVREPLNRRVSLTGKGKIIAENFDQELRELYA